MCFMTVSGFGTLSSSLVALPAPELGRPPAWRFASGAGQLSGWDVVPLG